ncbi:MAG: ABC transporter permease, partial [Marinobacter sp.]
MKTPLIRNERFVQIAAPLAVGVLVLLLWQITVTGFEVPKYIVPSPVDIVRSLVTNFASLFNALLMTLKITFLAFANAVVAGVAASLLFVQSKWIEISLFPYAVLMQVTPVVAIAPLIIIWVNDTTWALTICAVIVAIFPIISNTTLGLRSVDPNLLSMFRMYRA